MHWVPQQGNPGTGSCRIMCELKQGTSPRKSRAARVLRVVQETLVALSFMTSNFEDGLPQAMVYQPLHQVPLLTHTDLATSVHNDERI